VIEILGYDRVVENLGSVLLSVALVLHCTGRRTYVAVYSEISEYITVRYTVIKPIEPLVTVSWFRVQSRGGRRSVKDSRIRFNDMDKILHEVAAPRA